MLENIAKAKPGLISDTTEAIMTLPDYTLYDIGHFYLKNNHTNELIQFDDFRYRKIVFSPELVEEWVRELQKHYPDF
jgi:hypothetical protein